MTRIHTILIGQPQTVTDEKGTWRSTIFRHAISGPIALEKRGHVGDQVADTKNHGTLDQAVCCHPLEHYTYWNSAYQLDTPDTMLGPGSIGENWTLEEGNEATICVGDIYSVGSTRVQVSAPRYPCSKQERKTRLPKFLKRTMETLRTGLYLRVLTPGEVQSGDVWTLEARPQPEITLHAVNVCTLQQFDLVFAQQLMDTPELAKGWKRILRAKMDGEMD